MMSQEGGKQQNTAYGVFVQACWAQHKRQYPDELIHKEIEEFNKQCSVWWYNLSEQERDLVRRGRNAAGKCPSRLSPRIYQQATALEALIGYLYLANPARLEVLLNLDFIDSN